MTPLSNIVLNKLSNKPMPLYKIEPSTLRNAFFLNAASTSLITVSSIAFYDYLKGNRPVEISKRMFVNLFVTFVCSLATFRLLKWITGGFGKGMLSKT
jgi:hypothetical protein|tara:strand:+ start:2522 stop:2815 length:294 start_codon:yes stop_codon:yes gene_type:complete